MEEYNIDDFKYNYVSGNPAVYVGTYGKFNNGSVDGEWLDLTKFIDYEEFVNVCKYLHRDEEDPEFMLQDFEGFPFKLYSESMMSEDTFDTIQEMFNELDNEERDAFGTFIDIFGDTNINNFKESYQGQWNSEVEFAENYIDGTGMLDNHEFLAQYFDYKKFADDIFSCDYTYDNGFVFLNNY